MQTEPLLLIQQKGVGGRQGREEKVVGAEHTDDSTEVLCFYQTLRHFRMHSELIQSCTDPVSQGCCFCVQKEACKWQLPNKYWYLTSSAYQVLFPAQNLQQRKQVTNSLQCQKQLQIVKTMFILQLHSPSRRAVFANHKK